MRGIAEDRRRFAIEMLQALGSRGQDKQQLLRPNRRPASTSAQLIWAGGAC